MSAALAAVLATNRLADVVRSDPLASYRCAAWTCGELVAALRHDPPLEVLWNAGNSGSKTTGGLSVTVSMLQGRDHLLDWDGARIKLPLIRPPVSWVLGVESFKLAADARPKITLSGTGPVIGGKFYVWIDYVLSNTD